MDGDYNLDIGLRAVGWGLVGIAFLGVFMFSVFNLFKNNRRYAGLTATFVLGVVVAGLAGSGIMAGWVAGISIFVLIVMGVGIYNFTPKTFSQLDEQSAIKKDAITNVFTAIDTLSTLKEADPDLLTQMIIDQNGNRVNTSGLNV